MPIFTKRWNDPREPGDGLRVLVCRYRPRGLRKEDETWDAWMPQLGPSVELHAAAYGKGRASGALQWDAYRVAYLREMRAQREGIIELANRIRAGETITLLCSASCEQERRCHRSLLRDLINAEAEKESAKSA